MYRNMNYTHIIYSHPTALAAQRQLACSVGIGKQREAVKGSFCACPLQGLVPLCVMPRGVTMTVNDKKQRQRDWGSLKGTASRFLAPEQLSLYVRMGRAQKTSMLNTWAHTAEKNEVTFRRLFVETLGYEPETGRPSKEDVVDGASGTGEPSPEAPVRQVARANYTIGKATAICDDLRSFISELGDREMYRSLRECAETHLKGIETYLIPEVRLPRSTRHCRRQVTYVMICIRKLIYG